MSAIPEDPAGYRINYADEPGESDFIVTRLSDDAEVGRFPSRAAAIEAAEADAVRP